MTAELNALPRQAEMTGMGSAKVRSTSSIFPFWSFRAGQGCSRWSIPVRMINPFFKPVKIYCRTKLADFEEADQNIATSELRTSEPKGATPTQGSRESQFEQRDYSQLPDLSDSVLSDSDRVTFQTLFKKFRDVFAFPGDQLASRTSLVQHVIDTGDAVPIKQRPYRTSPEGKKEIDRQVQDMRGKESVSP